MSKENSFWLLAAAFCERQHEASLAKLTKPVTFAQFHNTMAAHSGEMGKLFETFAALLVQKINEVVDHRLVAFDDEMKKHIEGVRDTTTRIFDGYYRSNAEVREEQAKKLNYEFNKGFKQVLDAIDGKTSAEVKAHGFQAKSLVSLSEDNDLKHANTEKRIVDMEGRLQHTLALVLDEVKKYGISDTTTSDGKPSLTWLLDNFDELHKLLDATRVHRLGEVNYTIAIAKIIMQMTGRKASDVIPALRAKFAEWGVDREEPEASTVQDTPTEEVETTEEKPVEEAPVEVQDAPVDEEKPTISYDEKEEAPTVQTVTPSEVALAEFAEFAEGAAESYREAAGAVAPVEEEPTELAFVPVPVETLTPEAQAIVAEAKAEQDEQAIAEATVEEGQHDISDKEQVLVLPEEATPSTNTEAAEVAEVETGVLAEADATETSMETGQAEVNVDDALAEAGSFAELEKKQKAEAEEAAGAVNSTEEVPTEAAPAISPEKAEVLRLRQERKDAKKARNEAKLAKKQAEKAGKRINGTLKLDKPAEEAPVEEAPAEEVSVSDAPVEVKYDHNRHEVITN